MADVNISVGVDSRSANQGLKSIQGSLKGITNGANNVTSSFLKLAAAAGGIAAVVGGIRSIATVGGEFESLQQSLNTVFGGLQQGKAAFETAARAAELTGMKISDVTRAMVQLKGAGVEPTVAQLTAFADAASVSTDAAGAFQAAVSLVSRTTAGGLGLEELERLSDRGIPVYDMINEKLGLTRLQISKVGQTAEGARKIINALTDAMEQRFGGAALRNASTLNGVMVLTRNSLNLLQKDLFDAGFGQIFKETAVLAQALFSTLRTGIAENGEGFKQFASTVSDRIFDVIRTVVMGAAQMYATFQPILESIFNFIKRGVNNLITFANMLPPEFRSMGLIGFMMLGAKGKALVLIIASLFDSIVDKLSAGLKAMTPVFNFVIDLMNEAIEVINEAAGISNRFLGTNFEPIDLINPIDESMFDPSNIKSMMADIVSSIAGEFADLPFIGDAGTSTVVQNAEAFLNAFEQKYREMLGRLRGTDITPTGGGGAAGEDGPFANFLKGTDAAFSEFEKNVYDMEAYGTKIFNTMTQGWTDAIMNFVETGKLSFKDLFKSLLQEIIKMSANRMFIALFSQGGILGSMIPGLNKFLPGGKAMGGFIPSGRFAITGEKGPEVVQGPAHVTSTSQSAQMLNGGVTNVYYRIEATDPASFQAQLARDPSFVYAVTRAGQRKVPGR